MSPTRTLLLCAALALISCHPAAAQEPAATPRVLIQTGPVGTPGPKDDHGQAAEIHAPVVAVPPAPAPVVVFQPGSNPATDWVAKIYLWGGILTTALTVLGGLVIFALKKAAEVKPYLDALKPRVDAIEGRQDRQSKKQGSLQEQVTHVAIAAGVPLPAPPPGEIGSPPEGAPRSGKARDMGVAALLFLLLQGCATMSGDPAADRRGRITNALGREVFSAVLQVGLGLGTNALAGRNGQDAAQAVFESAGRIDGGAALERVLLAAAGPKVAPLADAAAAELERANPQTAAERRLIVNTIGAAIQTAANIQAKP